MILYKYKENGRDIILEVNNDHIKRCYTPENQARLFVRHILKKSISRVTGWQDIDFKDKKILDIGMGNGNILYYAKVLLDADVYGVDIYNYLDSDNYIKGKTFPDTDICDLPEELLGTFDIAYQCLFSVPFKDTAKVLLAASKALKASGHYLVSFDDGYYEHEDSFVVKILKEIYESVEIEKCNGRINVVVASTPRSNPTLTPMENYYCVVTNEEYRQFRNLRGSARLKFIDMSPEERKEFIASLPDEAKKV